MLRRAVQRFLRNGGGAYAVLERDFLVTTSTKRFLAIRLLVALVSVIVAVVVLLANMREDPDAISRAIFGAGVVVVPMLVLLVSPATAAPAISSERDGGTLELVLAAPVSATTFVLAKFAARFLDVAVLIFAMLPVTALCFLYGGVPLDTFLAFVTFALTTSAFCVAAGLLFSSYLRSAAAAVMGAFLFVLLAPPSPLAVLGLLHESGVPIDDDFVQAFFPLQPFYVWSRLGEAAFRGAPAPGVVWTHAAVMGGVSTVLLLLAIRRIRNEGRVSRRAGRRRAARGLFLGHPLLDRGVRGTLLWHPTRGGLFVPLLAVVGYGLLFWLGWTNGELDEPWLHLSGLGSLTVLAMLRVLAASSAAISGERKRGSLDLILAAPLDAQQIVRSTMLAVLLSTSPLLVLGLVHATAAAALGALLPEAAVVWFLTSTVLLVAVGAVGLRASVSASSPARSALWGFGVVFGLIGVTLLSVFVCLMVGFQEEALLALVLSLPPVMAYYVPWSLQELTERAYGSPDWWEFAPHAAIVVYILVTGVLLRQCVAVLDLRRG